MSNSLESLFRFNSLRTFLRHWIDTYPTGSWGLIGQMAEAARISPTMLSLILKGEKNMSQEQALSLAQFMALNEKEIDYFLLLADLEKAGTENLRRRIEKKLKNSQELALQLKNRIQTDITLDDEAKAIYYSHWYYTAIRNILAIDGFDTPPQIANHLNLSVQTVQKVVEFLIEHGLCKKVNGKLTYGFAQTHIDSNSLFVSRHHQNWRQRGFFKMERNAPEDLFFTSPMSLSTEAARTIRKLLPDFIEKVQKTAGPSDSEKAYCLNIDWFEY